MIHYYRKNHEILGFFFEIFEIAEIAENLMSEIGGEKSLVS